ncbi:MAG: topoisomerase DNA-binding C4 zinc finger domain-containing protein [Glaciecola sp.]
MKIDSELFGASGAAEAFGDCPECAAPLHMKYAKKGPFIGCTAYPVCTYIKPLKEVETTTIKVMSGVACPQCQADLAVKKGRFGMFIGCTAFPECTHIASLTAPQSEPAEQVACIKCATGHYVERVNKQGKTFFACSEYPKCKHILNHQPVSKVCPTCQLPVMLRTSDKLICSDPSCKPNN